MANINWSNETPPPERPFVPIISPKPGRPCRAILLSGNHVGVWTHFINERTVPCRGPDNPCMGCAYKAHRRWKCYLPGWHTSLCRFVLVELTARAMAEGVNNPANAVGFRRGIEIVCSRRGSKPNAPVMFELNSGRSAGTELPPSFDVKDALERIWYGGHDGRATA